MDKYNEQLSADDMGQIREMWADLNRRMTRLEEGTIQEGRRVCVGKIKSAQEDLARRYRKMSLLSFLCAVVFPIVYGIPSGFIEYPSLQYHILVACASFAFFCTCGVMDTYLCQGVRDINLARMSVTEVRRIAMSLKKTHHIFQIILIPCAVGMLALMMYPIIEEVWIGALFGGIVGIAIGLNIYFKMMKDYREMINTDQEDD